MEDGATIYTWPLSHHLQHFRWFARSPKFAFPNAQNSNPNRMASHRMARIAESTSLSPRSCMVACSSLFSVTHVPQAFPVVPVVSWKESRESTLESCLNQQPLERRAVAKCALLLSRIIVMRGGHRSPVALPPFSLRAQNRSLIALNICVPNGMNVVSDSNVPRVCSAPFCLPTCINVAKRV